MMQDRDLPVAWQRSKQKLKKGGKTLGTAKHGALQLSQPAVPVQAYKYGFADEGTRDEEQGAAAAAPEESAAKEEEEELLRALRAAFSDGGLISEP